MHTSTPHAKFSRIHSLIALGILLAILIAIRVVVIHGLETQNWSEIDSTSYLLSAQHIYQDGAFLNQEGLPELLRTPLYPLFLAGCYLLNFPALGIIIMQHILILCVAGYTYWIFRDDNRSVAILASALISYNVLITIYGSLILAETLFMALLTFSSLTIYQAYKAETNVLSLTAISALLGGLSTLARPISCLYFVPVTLFILAYFPKHKIRATIIFIVIFCAFPLSWMARNHSYYEVYTLSPNGNWNTLMYQAAGAVAIEQEGDYSTNFVQAQKELLTRANDRVRLSANKKELNQAQAIEIYGKLGREVIQDHFPGFIKNTIRNYCGILLGNASSFVSTITGLSSSASRILSLLYTLPAILLSIWGIVTIPKPQRPFALLAILSIGYLVSIAAIGGAGDSRFRQPAEPMFAILIGYGLSDAWNRLKDKLAPARND